LLCEQCFRLQMYGQMSETAVGKATGAGSMTAGVRKTASAKGETP
jgi:hypothetical protein